MRELEAVRQEAQLLQEQMKMVKHDIQKVISNCYNSISFFLSPAQMIKFMLTFLSLYLFLESSVSLISVRCFIIQ